MAKKLMTDEERFLKSFEKDPVTGCWNWAKAISYGGYGFFSIGSRKDGTRGLVYAHRFSYQSNRGQIPEGLELDHLCRNRKCVNPDHLEAVTRRINQLRGATFVADNFRKTHCKRGHEFTENNTYSIYGKRICRRCKHDHYLATDGFHRIRRDEYLRQHRKEG